MVELLVASGLATSKADARRGIQGKGFYLNDEPIETWTGSSIEAELQGPPEGRFVMLRKGKKNYVRLVLEPSALTHELLARHADPTTRRRVVVGAAAWHRATRTRPRMTSRTTVLPTGDDTASRAISAIVFSGCGLATRPPFRSCSTGSGAVRAILAASISRALSRSSGFPYSASRLDWLMSACSSSGVSGAMREAGGMSRVATTGVGAPRR